jgi:hypothetical protein
MTIYGKAQLLMAGVFGKKCDAMNPWVGKLTRETKMAGLGMLE